MNISLRVFAALAVLLFTRVPLSAADTVELKQQWQFGKKYYQTVKTEQQTNAEIAGRKMDQSMNMTIDLTMTVSPEVKGQPKRMTIRYERTAVQMTMNGQTMGFDSADPKAGNDPIGLNKTMGATVGKELKCVLDADDKVESIENYDEFVKSLAPSAAPGFDPSKMFSREGLTQMLQQGALHAMPGKPVAAGDSWPFQMSVDMPQLGKVGVSGKYTYKGPADHDGVKCAEIATDGTLSMELGGAGAGDSPLAKLGVAVTDGKITGTVWFDNQLGTARETQLVQEMTMSMNNPTDPTAKVTMPMKQHITVSLTKVEDVK